LLPDISICTANSPISVALERVVEPRSIVVVVVEELSVEWYGTIIGSYINIISDFAGLNSRDITN
jgi:hypothetical protein